MDFKPKIKYCDEIEPKRYKLIIQFLNDYNIHLGNNNNKYSIYQRNNKLLEDTEGYIIAYDIPYLGLAPLVWLGPKEYIYNVTRTRPIGRLKNNLYRFRYKIVITYELDWQPDIRLNINKLHLMIECDEHQHRGYSKKCERGRMDEIPESRIVFI